MRTIAGGNGDGDGCAELGGEAARKGDLGDLYTQGLGDVAGEEGQAEHDADATNHQDPLLHIHLHMRGRQQVSTPRANTGTMPNCSQGRAGATCCVHPNMLCSRLSSTAGHWAAGGWVHYIKHSEQLSPSGIEGLQSRLLRTLLEIWPVCQIWYTPDRGPMALATSLAPCTKDMAHAENTCK